MTTDTQKEHRNKLIKLVHVARRELGLDEPAYRAILLAQGGKESLAALSTGQMSRVLEYLKAQGFRVRKSPTDRKQATANAIAYVRHHGFGSRVSRTDVTVEKDDDLNTDVGPTNAEAEALMSADAERATTLLRTHGDAFRALVQQLLATGTVPAAEFAKVTGIAVTAAAPHAPSGPEPWHARWSAFAGDSA